MKLEIPSILDARASVNARQRSSTLGCLLIDIIRRANAARRGVVHGVSRSSRRDETYRGGPNEKLKEKMRLSRLQKEIPIYLFLNARYQSRFKVNLLFLRLPIVSILESHSVKK